MGGSRILPHIPGRFGLYLALTGARIRQGDCIASGLATHAVTSSDIPTIRERLADTGEIEGVLSAFARSVEPETPAETLELVADCFAHSTLAEIVEALGKRRAKGGRDATSILDVLDTRSPTSLAVTFRQMREGAALEMEDCMRMEYRILRRMLEGHDLFEGIRVVLIDKGDRPRWIPASLAEVRPELIEPYFAPLGQEELQLS